MKKKNGFLEILRFLFAMMIFIHHSGFLASDGADYPFKTAGFFAVEFFFILTGALAMRHIEANRTKAEAFPMKYSVDYTVSKLMRVWPYAAIGIFLSYVFYFLTADYSRRILDVIFYRWNIIFELFFLPMTSVMDISLYTYLNTPLWYLSVLLIALPLVMYLALKFRDGFVNYFMFLIPLILHGYLINKFGSIGNWGEYTLFTYSGVIRGLADLMLGMCAYSLGMKAKELIADHKAVATAAEIILYAFAIYTFSSNVDGYTYEAAVIFLTAAVGISISGESFTSKIGGTVPMFLGSLSLPIYCFHWPVYSFVSHYMRRGYLIGVLVTFAICVVLSITINLIIEPKKGRNDG